MYDASDESDLRVIVGGHATLCGSSRQSSDAFRLTTLAFDDSGEHSVRAPGALLPGAAHHREAHACRVEAGIEAELLAGRWSVADDCVRISAGRIGERRHRV